MIPFNSFMKNKLVYSYDITMRCNLRCSYCYASDVLDNKKTGDKTVASKVIQAMKDFKEQYPDHIFELDLLGGDPLLAKNLWDFLDEALPIGFDIWIVTNLMMGPRTLAKAKEYLQKYPNLGIAATWHSEGIKDEKFKENVLFFKDVIRPMWSQADEVWYDNFITSFVLYNDNETMYNNAKWCLDNGIHYGLNILYDDHMLYRSETKEEWSDETIFVWKNSFNYQRTRWEWDNKRISLDEFEERKLYKISYYYNVICHPVNWHIRYDGDIYNSCNYLPRKTSHIDKGIHPVKMYCKDSDCKCAVYGHKETYGER